MKDDFGTSTSTGHVVSYDERTLSGVVRVRHRRGLAGTCYPFRSWIFRSERPHRQPRLGEAVVLVFNRDQELVSVRTPR